MPTRLWILEVPFAERSVATAHGARWDADIRATVYRGEELPFGLKPFASQPFSWARWQEDDINQDFGNIPSAAHAFTPRPHQSEAAAAIGRAAKAGARGFLLADEVGLGKTIAALEGVRALKAVRPVRNLLIVSPLAVLPHWRRTIADMGLAHEGIRACVINYDRLKNLLDVPESAKGAKRKRTQNQRIAKSGTSLINWDVIIFDESHRLRHRTSQRSQAAARVASTHLTRHDAPFVLWMSATAGQNPTELSYLAPLLAQATGEKTAALKDFGPWLQQTGFHVTHDPRFDKWTWTEDDQERSRDIAMMSSLLFKRRVPLAIRRLPTDIAGWPEIQRILFPVELNSEQWALYDQAWTEFRREMNLAKRGRDPKVGMVARLRFRQKASLLRAEGTIEHTLDLIDNGHQVAISFQFLESLDWVREALSKSKVSVATMDGRDPQGREEQRLRFQRGEATVMLFTVVEGFSLHANELLPDGTKATEATRSLIVHDPRYSGIETLQIEGRTHRDGQAANAYYAYGADTVEEEITRKLIDRVSSTKALMGDEVAELEALLDSLSE